MAAAMDDQKATIGSDILARCQAREERQPARGKERAELAAAVFALSDARWGRQGDGTGMYTALIADSGSGLAKALISST